MARIIKQDPSEPPSEDAPAGPVDTDALMTDFPVLEPIGRQLKAMFDEFVTQPVPVRLRQLLDELERKRSEKS
jgi:hypothetical protein